MRSLPGGSTCKDWMQTQLSVLYPVLPYNPARMFGALGEEPTEVRTRGVSVHKLLRSESARRTSVGGSDKWGV